MDNRTSMFLLCENIRRLRKERVLSKKEMADKLGISEEALTEIEHDIISESVSCSIFDEIEKNFSISPHDILTRIV